jgi:hypothetical protein
MAEFPPLDRIGISDGIMKTSPSFIPFREVDMIKVRRCIGAVLAAACPLFITNAFAETVVIPFQSALPMSESCDALDALGWQPRHDDETCIVRFPIVVPVGKHIEQITVLHGTTDYAAASVFDAALTVYPATTPWQQAFDLFAVHDATVYGAFDVQATRLMAQSGKVFPDALVVSDDGVYDVSIALQSSAFVAGVRLTYQ